MQSWHAAELNLDEEVDAELRIVIVRVVGHVQASEVDVQGLIYEVLDNLELKHAEIDDSVAPVRLSVVVNSVVCLRMHLALAVSTNHADLKVHTLVCLSRELSLRLFDQDFEETAGTWREFNHVIAVVVRSVHICKVEVTRVKFLVRVDRV